MTRRVGPTPAKPDDGRSAMMIDLAISIGSIAAAFGALAFDVGDDASSATSAGYLLAFLAGAALLLRRRNPLLVLVVVAAARVLLTWATGNDVALAPALIIALFTVGRTAERRSQLIGVAVVVLVAASAIAQLGDEAFVAEFAGEVTLMTLPVVLGDAIRSRADRLEQRIETEADARVQAERIRIARDLHDVVAHGLSVIAVQSGVAAHLIDDDPDQAKEALEIINATGKASLEELRGMVGVLRSTDDAPLRPVPSDRDDLGELIEAARQAGLDVRTDVDGGFPPDASDAAVVAVHRIVGEALANVVRHAGPVGATVTVRHLDDHVDIDIVNEPGAAGSIAPSTGVGVIGMTERAESLGGSLDAGPTGDGGFRVRAVVPYRRAP